MSAPAISQRTAEDDDELFRLYRDVFGRDLTDGSRKRWRWQYLENPATTPAGPEIWVARVDGAVLGQYASMPVALWWGGREVRSSWGMDVFLRKEARGMGLGARLFTAWSDHVEVALGLGLTESSYGLFKKLGYDDVGPVPFHQAILDWRQVAARRLGAVPALAVAPLLRVAFRLLHRGRLFPDPSVTVAPARDPGPEHDALWESARASYAMCVRRDAAYLRWKYLGCPHRQYEMLDARRDGRLVGFAVSRHEDYRGLRIGWLVDLFTDAGDAGARDALLHGVLASFRAAGVARAQAFAMNDGLAAALSRAGFRRRRSPMQFCVRARAEGSVEVLRDRGRWHVVFGDSDMDR